MKRVPLAVWGFYSGEAAMIIATSFIILPGSVLDHVALGVAMTVFMMTFDREVFPRPRRAAALSTLFVLLFASLVWRHKSSAPAAQIAFPVIAVTLEVGLLVECSYRYRTLRAQRKLEQHD